MPSKSLIGIDRIVRYVSWGKLLKDENDVVLGTLPSAFGMRPVEDTLSVSWCEYFTGDAHTNLICCVAAINNSDLNTTAKGHFAVAEVAKVDEFMRSAGKKVRFLHEPMPDNGAHVALHRWPRNSDDLELLTRLGEDVWSEVYSQNQVELAVGTACEVSPRGAE